MTTYNHEMRCCSGYGPKPNCLRKLYLLLCMQNIMILTKLICSNLQIPMWH